MPRQPFSLALFDRLGLRNNLTNDSEDSRYGFIAHQVRSRLPNSARRDPAGFFVLRVYGRPNLRNIAAMRMGFLACDLLCHDPQGERMGGVVRRRRTPGGSWEHRK